MPASSRPQPESPDVLTGTGVAVLTFAFLAFHAWVNVALAGRRRDGAAGTRPLLR